MTPKYIRFILFVTVFLLGSAELCYSQLSIRNKLKVKATIAIGFYRNGNWISKGWYHIQPNETRTIVNIPQSKIKYYLYIRGVDYSDDYMEFCIDENYNFELVRNGECIKRRFFAVEVNSPEYTITLQEEIAGETIPVFKHD